MIPARFQSARFPGKPLVPIMGKPMVVRTWEQACKAITLNKVVVATDDERIAKACTEAGAEVIMTSSECPNGAPSQPARCHRCCSRMQVKYSNLKCMCMLLSMPEPCQPHLHDPFYMRRIDLSCAQWLAA